MPALIQQAPAAALAPAAVQVNAATPQAIYKAFSAQRRELKNQLDQLEDKRGDLQRQLREGEVKAGADRAGIEARVTELDKRISDAGKALSQADASVATAAATPGAVPPDPPRQRNGPPPEAFVLMGMFIVVVLLPLSLAFARRIWRRGSLATVTSFPAEMTERLNRLDQSVDSIAIEVERIGEAQRFNTKLQAERAEAQR